MATPTSTVHAAPLVGATVLITRPAATAQTLKRAVRALGGTPLGLPAIGIRGTDDVTTAKAGLVAAKNADVVIFVSPNAVKYSFRLLPSLRFARATQVAAVGTTTARALQRRGVKHVVAPTTDQTSEGLLALPELQKLRGRRVVLIGAPSGRDLLAQTLTTRKARVHRIHVYQRTQPVWRKPQLAALDAATPPLITVVTSADAFANLRGGLPLITFATLAAGDWVVSSLRLAEILRKGQCHAVHIARSPAPRDLLHAACGALAHHRL